nr:structural protein [Tolivirales sp.]
MTIKISKRKPARKTTKKQPVTRSEVTSLGRAIRQLGSLGGSALGAAFGQPSLGGTLGAGAGAALSRWMGQGDYSVNSNSLWAGKTSNSIPAMHKSDQSVRISHREFLTRITGSTTYAVRARFNLNPGLSSTFPWLSQIATRFQEYRIHGLVFHYIPTSGAAVSSTNPALGAVMMQTSYRASDAAPTSKVELLNEYWSTETIPSEPCFHPIECDPKQSVFPSQWVRSAEPPSGESVMLYDLGVTSIAVEGMPASGNVVGDLWITYDVELRKPLVTSDVVSGFPLLIGSSVGTATEPLANFTATTQRSGEISVSQLQPSPGSNHGSIRINFDRTASGVYEIILQTGGITTTSLTGINTTNSGVTSVPWRPDGSGNPWGCFQTATNNDFILVQMVAIPVGLTADPYLLLYPSTNVAWYSAGTPTFNLVITKVSGTPSLT